MAKLELKQKFEDLYLGKRWKFYSESHTFVVTRIWITYSPVYPSNINGSKCIQSIPEVKAKYLNNTYSYFLKEFTKMLHEGTIVWVT